MMVAVLAPASHACGSSRGLARLTAMRGGRRTDARHGSSAGPRGRRPAAPSAPAARRGMRPCPSVSHHSPSRADGGPGAAEGRPNLWGSLALQPSDPARRRDVCLARQPSGVVGTTVATRPDAQGPMARPVGLSVRRAADEPAAATGPSGGDGASAAQSPQREARRPHAADAASTASANSFVRVRRVEAAPAPPQAARIDRAPSAAASERPNGCGAAQGASASTGLEAAACLPRPLGVRETDRSPTAAGEGRRLGMAPCAAAATPSAAACPATDLASPVGASGEAWFPCAANDGPFPSPDVLGSQRALPDAGVDRPTPSSSTGAQSYLRAARKVRAAPTAVGQTADSQTTSMAAGASTPPSDRQTPARKPWRARSHASSDRQTQPMPADAQTPSPDVDARRQAKLAAAAAVKAHLKPSLRLGQLSREQFKLVAHLATHALADRQTRMPADGRIDRFEDAEVEVAVGEALDAIGWGGQTDPRMGSDAFAG
jgi:hypothetical protein